MVTYSVHEPPGPAMGRLQSAERLVFVKDGFSWLAAALPPVWLLWKRMWLEAAAYIALSGLIVWALTAAGAPSLGNALVLIVQIIFGFEAGALQSAALERRGWRQAGTVSGRDAEDCERRFLEVWLPTHTEIPPAPEREAESPVGPSPPRSWTDTALAQLRATGARALERGRRAVARA